MLLHSIKALLIRLRNKQDKSLISTERNDWLWRSIPSANHWLFLDIDGVLHRAENGSLEYMPELEMLVGRNAHLGIFLSTNWRIGVERQELLRIFPDVIRARIAGCTPDLDGSVAQYVRWHECMAVVQRFSLRRYTFIDDTARLFPPDCQNLFLTDRHEGLNHARAMQLHDLINLYKT